MGERNWAGTYTYSARRMHEPRTVDEVRRIVGGARSVRALGSRHSFNDIADADDLVSLARLDVPVEIDREAMTVTVGGGMTYGALSRELVRHDLALHAMASLPHITVAGAIATGTHGSGDRAGNLATAVAGLEIVTSEGEIVRARRGDADFAGMVVSLGALGIVTRVTLDVEPVYRVRQQVFLDLPWEVALARFDEVTSAADSVSLFTDFGDSVRQVWCKERLVPGDVPPLRADLFGARAATVQMHPAELDASACTAQLGVPGLWADRLVHFRPDATPASGDEIQAEYFVAREHAVAALGAMQAMGERIRPHLWISEIRTVAADDLWLSEAYGADCVAIHFSFFRDPDMVKALLPDIEAALAPFTPRPHWGKMFAATAEELDGRYPRMADFRALAARMDPRGAFRNAYMARVSGTEGGPPDGFRDG